LIINNTGLEDWGIKHGRFKIFSSPVEIIEITVPFNTMSRGHL
jgi:hypothetical protein